MKCFICVVFLLSAATGRTADNRQLDEMSMRWVAYYAAAYHVPLELVEAVIDEESGWNPYAV